MEEEKFIGYYKVIKTSKGNRYQIKIDRKILEELKRYGGITLYPYHVNEEIERKTENLNDKNIEELIKKYEDQKINIYVIKDEKNIDYKIKEESSIYLNKWGIEKLEDHGKILPQIKDHKNKDYLVRIEIKD